MPSVLGYLPLNRKTAPMLCLAFKLSHASPPYPVFLPPLLYPRRPAVPNAPLPRPGTQPLGGGQDECSFAPGVPLGRVAYEMLRSHLLRPTLPRDVKMEYRVSRGTFEI